MMGIGIREDNLHASTGNTGSCARTLQPVVIPTAHHFNGKLIHVVIVFTCRFPSIKRSVTLLVERITVGIPVFTQSFITAVFHGPHGVLLRFIDVKHLTAVLSLIDVKHLTTANSSSTMRIILITNGFHLQHMLTADTLIAALIEQDTGVIAVIDNGIPHQGSTL